MATLGRTSGENNGRNVEAGQARAFYIGQMTENGTITAIAARLQGWMAASTGILGLYKGSSSAPSGALLASGSVSGADGVVSLQTISGLSVAASTGDHIWLAIISLTGQLRFAIDTAVTGYYYAIQTASGALPDPFGTPIENASDYQGIGAVTYTTGTPATLSSPTPTGVIGTETTANIGATTNQGAAGSNTLYVVRSTSNIFSGVTAAQVKAGQNAAGNTTGVTATNGAISSTSPSVAQSSLAAGTTYYYAAVQENANGFSNVVTGSFTTASSVAVGVRLVLKDTDTGVVAANQTNLVWCLRAASNDEATLLKGTTGTTDASGVFALTNAAVGALGASIEGFIRTADGTKRFWGTLVVVDMATADLSFA